MNKRNVGCEDENSFYLAEDRVQCPVLEIIIFKKDGNLLINLSM
jgi:hypothetical protein